MDNVIAEDKNKYLKYKNIKNDNGVLGLYIYPMMN